ncbi:MAG: hypothetical protein FWD49_02700 [Firmicutes bacterium]|nr:hypothetical protein [Bacillota bacterium]
MRKFLNRIAKFADNLHDAIKRTVAITFGSALKHAPNTYRTLLVEGVAMIVIGLAHKWQGIVGLLGAVIPLTIIACLEDHDMVNKANNRTHNAKTYSWVKFNSAVMAIVTAFVILAIGRYENWLVVLFFITLGLLVSQLLARNKLCLDAHGEKIKRIY